MKLNKLMTQVLLVLIFITLHSAVKAYWIKPINKLKENTVSIGSWEVLETPYDHEWDLGTWDDNRLTKPIPEGQVFSYEGRLYVVQPGSNYTPKWHGMPGSKGSYWATINIDINWQPNTSYRDNSVVIHLDKYYITDTNYYGRPNWYPEEPGKHRSWLEIEPIEDKYFEKYNGYDFYDYAKPNKEYIVYK